MRAITVIYIEGFRGWPFRGAQITHLHTHNIPGYDYGAGKVAKSPTSLDELKELTASYRFIDEDVVHLFHDAVGYPPGCSPGAS
jgi:hypothetical protein